MAKKLRTLRSKRSSKQSSKRGSRHRKAHRLHTRKNRRVLKGGNYETDITTRTTEGTPTKPLKKLVVAVPGRGVMDGEEYEQLMEDLDRNGNSEYY